MKNNSKEPQSVTASCGVCEHGDGLSIVVPVYNEQGAVAATAEELLKVAETLGSASEVIFVDDSSTDGTSNILEKISGIRVITHPCNRGYGAALKTGICAAKYRWIAITDADCTYPNHKIPGLLEVAKDKQCDMVVGNRTGIKVHIPLIRRPAKWCMTKLASYLCGRSIPDLNSGLRIFERDTILEFIGILPEGFSFTTTITLALIANGRRVEYVPIEYHQRSGQSKIRPISDTLKFIQLIIRMVMYFNPLRVFVPISLTLFVGSLSALLYRMIRGRGLASLSVILFVAGIQVLTTGMIADLIDRRLLLANRRNRTKGDKEQNA